MAAVTGLVAAVTKLFFSRQAAAEKAELVAAAALAQARAEKAAASLACAQELAVERVKRDTEREVWIAKVEAKNQQLHDFFKQCLAREDEGHADQPKPV